MTNWKKEEDKLTREFEFADFVQAFSFLTKVAIVSEKANHHPEMYNVYNKVRLSLSTHDAGGKITEKDHELAASIDKLL